MLQENGRLVPACRTRARLVIAVPAGGAFPLAPSDPTAALFPLKATPCGCRALRCTPVAAALTGPLRPAVWRVVSLGELDRARQEAHTAALVLRCTEELKYQHDHEGRRLRKDRISSAASCASRAA
jgi:hypothetical protein